MKQIIAALNVVGAVALLALAVGCATTQSKENALVASGFKVITPSTAAQQTKLQSLPANKVTMVQESGKTHYVFPDVANNRAYVGGPQQLQAYKALRMQQNMATENLEAAEMNEDASMDWGGWGGWGGWGMGWY